MKLKIIWQMVNMHADCALIIIVFICEIQANNINHLGEGTIDLHRLHTGGQRGKVQVYFAVMVVNFDKNLPFRLALFALIRPFNMLSFFWLFKFILMGFVSTWNPLSLQCQPLGGALSPFRVTTTMSLNWLYHARPVSNGPGCLPTPWLHKFLLMPSSRRLRLWLPWEAATAATAASVAACACDAQRQGTCL